MRKITFGGKYTKIAVFLATIVLTTLLFFGIKDFHLRFGEGSEMVIDQFFFNFNLLYAILATFTVFAIWEKYNHVIEVINEEAACLLNILNLSRQIESRPVRKKISDTIREYVESIIGCLWQRNCGDKEAAYFHFENIFGLIEHMKSHVDKENIIFDHMIDQMKETAKVRANRIALLQQRITPIQWVTLILLPIGLVFSFMTVGGETWLRLAMLLALVTIFVLITFIIADLDEPIGGEWSVSDAAYRTVLDNIKTYEHREKKRL